MRKTILLTILISTIFWGCKQTKPLINQPPTIEFLNPISSYVEVSITDTLQVMTIAEDKDGEVKKVDFYLDGENIAEVIEYPWNQPLTFSDEGEFRLACYATDNLQLNSDTIEAIIKVIDPDKANIQINVAPQFNKKENDPITISVNSYSDQAKITKTSIFLDNVLIASDTVSYLQVVVDSMQVGLYETYALVEDETGKTTKSDVILIKINENKPPYIEFSYININSLIPGGYIHPSAEAQDSDGGIEKIEFYINDSLVYTGTSGNNISFPYYLAKSGDYKLYAIAYDTDMATAKTEDLFFHVKDGLLTEGELVKIIPSINENEFLALNYTTNQLWLLYPFENDERRLELPYSNPIDMYYVLNDKKLYIVYENNGIISIWDQENETIQNIEYSANAKSISIVVDKMHDRIYINSTLGIKILNMSSGEVLNTNNTIQFSDFVIDTENQWLITAEHYQTVIIRKYSLVNDQFNLIQEISDQGNYTKGMSINRAKNYFCVITSGSGNDGNGNHLAYKTTDINQIAGMFSDIEPAYYSCFSSDGETFLIADYVEDIIFLYDAETFQLVEQVSDIIRTREAIFVVNNSRTKLLVFSKAYHGENDLLLYYNLN